MISAMHALTDPSLHGLISAMHALTVHQISTIFFLISKQHFFGDTDTKTKLNVEYASDRQEI